MASRGRGRDGGAIPISHPGGGQARPPLPPAPCGWARGHRVPEPPTLTPRDEATIDAYHRFRDWPGKAAFGVGGALRPATTSCATPTATERTTCRSRSRTILPAAGPDFPDELMPSAAKGEATAPRTRRRGARGGRRRRRLVGADVGRRRRPRLAAAAEASRGRGRGARGGGKRGGKRAAAAPAAAPASEAPAAWRRRRQRMESLVGTLTRWRRAGPPTTTPSWSTTTTTTTTTAVRKRKRKRVVGGSSRMGARASALATTTTTTMTTATTTTTATPTAAAEPAAALSAEVIDDDDADADADRFDPDGALGGDGGEEEEEDGSDDEAAMLEDDAEAAEFGIDFEGAATTPTTREARTAHLLIFSYVTLVNVTVRLKRSEA